MKEREEGKPCLVAGKSEQSYQHRDQVSTSASMGETFLEDAAYIRASVPQREYSRVYVGSGGR